MVKLDQAQYGKDNIRVYKVHKDDKTGVHDVVEMRVCVLLKGEIDVSYTEADNKVVVATDTMKNTVYIMAKQHPVSPPELFASIVANHFVETYKHIHSAIINVITLRWSRMTVEGKPHPHSFYRDGQETRNVQAVAVEGKGIDIHSSLGGLLVLKSTGSQFHSFVDNEYRTLKDTWDRILSTEVTAGWKWNTYPTVKDVEADIEVFNTAFDDARQITIETFAKENSPSVQNTMYKMCEQILAKAPKINAVDYSLPNKHYFEIDLSWHKGLQNTGKDAEVYAPQSDPNGLIECTVTR